LPYVLNSFTKDNDNLVIHSDGRKRRCP